MVTGLSRRSVIVPACEAAAAEHLRPDERVLDAYVVRGGGVPLVVFQMSVVGHFQVLTSARVLALAATRVTGAPSTQLMWAHDHADVSITDVAVRALDCRFRQAFRPGGDSAFDAVLLTSHPYVGALRRAAKATAAA